MAMIKIMLPVWLTMLKPKGLPDRPSSIQSVTDSHVGDAAGYGPLSEGFRLQVIRQAAAAASVISLLFCVSPPAVSGFVVPVVVDSVDTHSVWALPHIGKEISEHLPPVADSDPSASIAREFVVRRTLASGAYMVPNVMGSSPRHAVGTMKSFSFSATAGSCVPSTERSCGYIDLFPTITQTHPSYPADTVGCTEFHNKPAKPFPHPIKQLHGYPFKSVVYHRWVYFYG